MKVYDYAKFWSRDGKLIELKRGALASIRLPLLSGLSARASPRSDARILDLVD